MTYSALYDPKSIPSYYEGTIQNGNYVLKVTFVDHHI